MKSTSFAVAMAALLFSVAPVVPAVADDANRASKILTAELAQKILGTPVKPNSSNSTSDTDVGKTWVSRAGYSASDASGTKTISVLIRHATTKEEALKIFGSSKSTFNGVDVKGLGDACYRTEKPAQLNVLKGANWLIISVGTFSNPDTARQEQLAKEILPKITF